MEHIQYTMTETQKSSLMSLFNALFEKDKKENTKTGDNGSLH